MPAYEKLIGIIVPSAGTATELAYHTYAPENVAVATARVKFNRISYQDLSEMVGVVRYAAEDICQTDPDVIVFGSMMASCISGDAIRNIVEQHTGIPCITTFSSLVEVLHTFSFRRLGVVSAFAEELGLLLKTGLQKQGVECPTMHTLVRPDGAPYCSIKEIEQIPFEELCRAAEDLALDGCDALLFDSSGFRGIDRIPELEAQFGLPVLFSDQFTLWTALRTLGAETVIPRLGRIFER